MKQNIKTGLYLLAITACILSCDRKNNSTQGHVDEEAQHELHQPADPDFAILTTEQMKTIGIELGNIEQKQLSASLKTNGILKVPNQNKAGINSAYSGIIKSLLVQPGNTVSKGQVIATITNPDFIHVQADFISIHSKIILAEQEYNRQKELNAGNAGALKNLQAADAALKGLMASRASLKQQVQLMGINPASLSSGKLVSTLPVRSPIKGVVSNVMVKMGSYADLSTLIAEVVDNSQLHLDLFVYEKDLSKLKNNQTIHFTVTNNPVREYDAEIFSLGSSFENDSKAVSVHALVKGDKSGLIDGMSVTATVSLDKATLPAIPSAAIVNNRGQDFIFIVDSVDARNKSTRFKRIPVIRGASEVGYSEVKLLTAIPELSKVVVKGAFFILASQVNLESHGH